MPQTAKNPWPLPTYTPGRNSVGEGADNPQWLKLELRKFQQFEHKHKTHFPEICSLRATAVLSLFIHMVL